MLFNSFEFLLFFPIVTLLYFLLPHKVRWLHLLAASCVFYMAFIPAYILILFFLITIDYAAGILIEKSTGSRRTSFLIMSIAANIGLLFFFKYAVFFTDHIHAAFSAFGSVQSSPLVKIILPVGLSFHTFQALSYTIEVYRGNQKAERHYGIYALYIMFYPQLVAGPIERPQNMLHQFREKHTFNYDLAVSGLRLMLWGLFKKVVIADRIALVTDPVYANPHGCPPAYLLITLFLFAYQMYCDFSGYSDIAIGAARVMGYNLMLNFDLPFRSKSITEFWRRWHISLSTWFYDYVFNPFITYFRDRGKAAIIIGLLITFVLSGMWHGAGWQFIVFGLLHGIVVIYEYFTRKARKKLFSSLTQSIRNVVSKVLTLTFVFLAWIIFRANNLLDARYILSKIPAAINLASFSKVLLTDKQGGQILACFGLVLLLELAHLLRGKTSKEAFIAGRPKVLRWGMYLVFIFAIVFFGVFNNRQFIYFQF